MFKIFLTHLVYQPKSLIQSCFIHCSLSSSLASLLSSSVHTPSDIVRYRAFIFSMNIYMCPWYMHMKYLVILTYSFEIVAILVLLSDLLSYVTGSLSNRNYVSHFGYHFGHFGVDKNVTKICELVLAAYFTKLFAILGKLVGNITTLRMLNFTVVFALRSVSK